MRTIYRFEVTADGQPHDLPMSPGAVPSRIENTGIDRIEFWAETDTDQVVQRRFIVTGTGHPAPDGTYLGTGGRNDAGLVWHLWEVPL